MYMQSLFIVIESPRVRLFHDALLSLDSLKPLYIASIFSSSSTILQLGITYTGLYK